MTELEINHAYQITYNCRDISCGSLCDTAVPFTLTAKAHAFLGLTSPGRHEGTAIIDGPPGRACGGQCPGCRDGAAFPPVVCLCGSTRFADEFNRQRKDLTERGEIVLSIEVVTTQAREQDPPHADPALKARLDELHKRKIDLADYVLVVNPGGYIGKSTRSEIAYAAAHGKPVRYLEAPGRTA
jgi:hypothetical protein